jgi:hypothetical protein
LPPLAIHSVLTRCTYAGLGLLVTRRWISWRLMNGATFWCAARASSALRRLPVQLLPSLTTMPLKSCFGWSSWKVGWHSIGA